MENKLRINTFDLLMCFSAALDLISPMVSSHQIRVAYIALMIAKEYKLPKEKLNQIVIAGAIHDLGATTVQERNEIIKPNFESDGRHELVGYNYLMGSVFHDVADIVKHHHRKWDNGLQKEDVSIEGYLLHLADRIDVAINKEEYILHQREKIT